MVIDSHAYPTRAKYRTAIHRNVISNNFPLDGAVQCVNCTCVREYEIVGDVLSPQKFGEAACNSLRSKIKQELALQSTGWLPAGCPRGDGIEISASVSSLCEPGTTHVFPRPGADMSVK